MMFKILIKTILLLTVFSFGFSALADGHAKGEKDKADGWKTKGQAVFWYQTYDNWGKGSLFDEGPKSSDSGFSLGAGGVQFSATNKNVFGGLGVGVEVSGLTDLGLDDSLYFKMRQNVNGDNGVAVTQAYITYGLDNTKFKLGRQTFAREDNPFAYSEPQFLFKNTFDAVTITNTDLENTTIIYSYIFKENKIMGDLSEFNDFYSARDGLNRLTVRNKSIDGVVLTGHYYWMPDFVWLDGGYASDANALWFDAKFKVEKVSVALQAGFIGGLDNAIVGRNIGPYVAKNADSTTALGAQVSGKAGKYKWKVAYANVGDGGLNISNNFGSGFKSPMFALGGPNHNAMKRDSDTLRFTVTQPLGKGNLAIAYNYSDLGPLALKPAASNSMSKGGEGTYQALDFIYKGSFDKKTKYFISLFHQNDDRQADETQNMIRFWVRYNF